jgi:hypothetical protein
MFPNQHFYFSSLTVLSSYRLAMYLNAALAVDEFAGDE